MTDPLDHREAEPWDGAGDDPEAQASVDAGNPAGDASAADSGGSDADGDVSVDAGNPASDADAAGAGAGGSDAEGGPDAVERDVAAALSDLDAAGDLPPSDQVSAFTAVHQTLQATLARIDDD